MGIGKGKEYRKRIGKGTEKVKGKEKEKRREERERNRERNRKRNREREMGKGIEKEKGREEREREKNRETEAKRKGVGGRISVPLSLSPFPFFKPGRCGGGEGEGGGWIEGHSCHIFFFSPSYYYSPFH